MPVQAETNNENKPYSELGNLLDELARSRYIRGPYNIAHHVKKVTGHNVSGQTVSKYLYGKSLPEHDFINAFADAFELTPRERSGLAWVRAYRSQPENEELITKEREELMVKRAEATLRESEKLLRTVIANVPVVLFALDREGIITLSEGKGLEALGLRPGELVGFSVFELYRDVPQILEDVRRALAGEAFSTMVDVGGLTFETRYSPLPGQNGEIAGVIGVAVDVTERKTLEEQLAYQAIHDPLTDLPNRTLFMDRLEHALARADRQEGKVAVLFIGLDNLKVLNEGLSHQVGDQLLVAVAGRLQACLRSEDTIARFGGDEFTVLLEDITSVNDAVRVAERIAKGLQAPFVLGGREVFITASVGIALSTSGHDRPDNLLCNADVALYRAKAKGKARYEVYDSSMSAYVIERLELENDLRRALERNEFKVYYQPKVLLDTNLQQYLRFSGSRAVVARPKVREAPRIAGMEALVRWEHPERGLLSPSKFLPLAEESGLILPIGQWVLEEVCRQGREWQEQHPNDPPLMMCVNVSPRQFQHPDLAQDLTLVLRESGLDPRGLCLEITEDASMEHAQGTITTLRKLKGLGIRLAIDDFGTGYSSLSYLRHFPIDYLKIDCSFIERLRDDPKDDSIVSGIIALAHALGIQVTAEGVETRVQMAQLQGLGCDLAQGNYFSEPLTSEAASELLASEPYW